LPDRNAIHEVYPITSSESLINSTELLVLETIQRGDPTGTRASCVIYRRQLHSTVTYYRRELNVIFAWEMAQRTISCVYWRHDRWRLYSDMGNV